MTEVLSESSVPTTDALTRIRIFLRPSPALKIVNPLTIVFIAELVLGEANDSWSATRRAVLVLLFGAVVASTITAFAGDGAILILALNLLWTTL